MPHSTRLPMLTLVNYFAVIVSDELLNLKTLTEQLSGIAESFIAFGSVAGVSPTALIEIAARCSNFTDSMTEVCDLWLQKCHQEQTPPTWSAVSEILHLIGHDELSHGLLEVYKTGMKI